MGWLGLVCFGLVWICFAWFGFVLFGVPRISLQKFSHTV